MTAQSPSTREKSEYSLPKSLGVVAGIVILLGTLAIIIVTWLAPQNDQDPLTILAELSPNLEALDEMEARGTISPKAANAKRKRYLSQAKAALSESQIQVLIEIKYNLATLNDLQTRGVVSGEVIQAEKLRYMAKAQIATDGAIEMEHLAILLNYLDSPSSNLEQPLQDKSSLFSPPIIWVLLLSILIIIATSWLLISRITVARRKKSTALLHQANSPAPKTQPTAKQQVNLSSSAPDLLTKREQEVLQLVAEGLTNREIAKELTITSGTTKVHLSNIYSKLGVNRRVKAIAKAQELGILSFEH
jgi:DNA-binding CsgD family transcriptional regulator